MPVWQIEPVEQRPQVTLEKWSVREVPLHGTHAAWTPHLVGWSREDSQGQVSSPVLRFDPSTGRALTRSGRIYQLSGPPASDSDSEYVWARWKAVAHLSAERDLTQDVYDAVVRATGRVPEHPAHSDDGSALEMLAAKLEGRALALVWSGTEWLSAPMIQERSRGRGPSCERLRQWEEQRRLFSLHAAGERRYASYCFGPDVAPRPVIAEVMRVLAPISACGVAAFFESTSSFLGGRRPRELTALDPQAVIAAALNKRESEDFCG